MSDIHSTAYVEDGASIGEGVEIGPFSVVGHEVSLGAGVRIHAHVVITGRTSIGAGCEIFPNATLGEQPQDTKYAGEPTRLEIGENTLIRENVTIHRGTAHGNGVTRIGSGCFLMVNAHIAHDCTIGDKVILTNQALLAGHCEVGEHAVIGANAMFQQFVRVGKHAYVVSPSAVISDIIPFGIAKGIRQDCTLQGLNLIGLKHRGYSRDTIKCLREAYRMIFDGPPVGIVDRATRAGDRFVDCAPVVDLVTFITAHPDRKLSYPVKRGTISLEEAV